MASSAFTRRRFLISAAAATSSAWLLAACVGELRIFFTIALRLLLPGSVIPLVVAFVLLQRYWQSGLATGGVKA